MLQSILHHPIISIIIFFALLHSCDSPERYPLPAPKGFVAMAVPTDNPTSYEGVELGRHLFYEPKLSGDGTISCAHCHIAALAFTDAKTISSGIAGRLGKRSAPSLLNIGFHYEGLFWDGRSPTLEDQALHPIRDSLEMDGKWEDILSYLNNTAPYPSLFHKAFGSQQSISKENIGKALAQFQRSLVSIDSKFDRVMREETVFTANEKRGWTIFFDADYPNTPMAECSHCHADPLFTDLRYINNGLDYSKDMNNFKDAGLGAINHKKMDNGKFKVPSLRNIAITAPYMHDGRFETLEEVIEHYNSGGHYAHNLDPNIRPLHLTAQDKADLIAFLHTLTDTVALQNKAYTNPF